MDVVLAIDESGSMDAASWSKEMSFATKLIDSYTVSADAANFAIVYFAQVGRILLTMSDDATSVKNVLQTTVRRGGMTCNGCGLQSAYTAFTLPLPGRSDADKVLIFMGDGHENIDWGYIDRTAVLFSSDTTRIAISTSSTSYNLDTLKKVAADPTHVLIATIDTLTKNLDAIIQLSCTELPVQACGQTCYGFCGCNKNCYCPRCTNTSLCTSTSCVDGQNYNGCKAKAYTCPDDHNACTYSKCSDTVGCQNLDVNCTDESMLSLIHISQGIVR